jgi:hypothetical protein
MITMWSRNLRPSTLRHCTSRPSTTPLNRQHMYAMGRAVHVLVVQFILSSLICLPPKAKLSKVTIPMAVVTVIPHLSLGWLLAHSLVGIVHSWWLFSFRKEILRDGRVSGGFLMWLGFGTQTCLWGGAFGGSSNTPSLTTGSMGLGGVILINLGVVEGFSLEFKSLNSQPCHRHFHPSHLKQSLHPML